jgi:SSS family solute:Na+ symporter
VEFALLVLYAVILFGAARAAGPGTPAGFYVNNRESGAWSVGFSILVSCVGASATIGMIGMAFAVGTPAFWWLGAGAAGLVLLSLALAGKVRGSGAYTLPHMVETFLGPSVRPMISALVVVAWSAILAAQFSALGRVLGPLTGLSSPLCLVIGLVLICGHTLLGGQSAVMRADRIQAVIILSALAMMLGWLTRHNPAWTDNVRLQAVNADFPPEKLLYFLVIVGANYVVCPMLFGRMLSARDERSARLGGLLGAAGIALCAALIVAVGLACQGLVPARTPQDEVLGAVLTVMPYWMQLVVSFALVSAIVSSADSCLVTAAAVLSFDLLGRGAAAGQGVPVLSARRGRVCVILLGLAGAALSLWGKGIFGFLLMAYDVFACGVVVPVGIGLLLRGKSRIDPRWACAAVATGGLLGLAAAISGDPLWSYAGMAASGVLVLAGGLTKRAWPLRHFSR